VKTASGLPLERGVSSAVGRGRDENLVKKNNPTTGLVAFGVLVG
jgi:hypothetical protein